MCRSIQDEEIQLKLLQRERDYSSAQDARFFAEVAEYIDLLQLDVARNKKSAASPFGIHATVARDLVLALPLRTDRTCEF